ncbi:MAG: ribosome maturation factor RimM [Kovacikia sp.]
MGKHKAEGRLRRQRSSMDQPPNISVEPGQKPEDLVGKQKAQGREQKTEANEGIGKQAEQGVKIQSSPLTTQPSPLSSVPPYPSPSAHPLFLEIGKIVSAQGMKGEVRVYPDSDFPERFLQPGTRWLVRLGETEPQPIELLNGRYLSGKGLYVVQFAGVDNRDRAESLQGSKLLVLQGDRPPLEDDEFHILDLIGLEVFEQATQTLIGSVIRVIPAGNDLLEVRRATRAEAAPKQPETVLIPFVKPIVPVVDLQHRRIEITPPVGLIDL